MQSPIYGSLEQFLRRKTRKCIQISTFSLNAFIETPLKKRDGEFVLLYRHDFKDPGLIAETKNFDSLREKLILKGVLVWKKSNQTIQILFQRKIILLLQSGVLNYINKEKTFKITIATVEDLSKLM